MLRKILSALFIIIILTVPFLLSYLMSKFHIYSDWVGFWGSYLGGFFTLIGVALTIRHSKCDADEKQRLSIMPYLSINKEETNNNEIIGLTYCLSEMQKENKYIYFDELKLDGNGVNVGMGPLVNCAIKDIKIENRVIDHHTNEASVVIHNGKFHFNLEILSISLEKKDMTETFLKNYSSCWNSERMSTPPYITIQFYFYYEDVMGRQYRQRAEYHTQIIKKELTITEPVHMRFKKIYKPELI